MEKILSAILCLVFAVGGLHLLKISVLEGFIRRRIKAKHSDWKGWEAILGGLIILVFALAGIYGAIDILFTEFIKLR